MFNRKIIRCLYIPLALVMVFFYCPAFTQEYKSVFVEFLSLVLLGVISIEAWLYAQKAHIEDVRSQFLSLLIDNCAKISAARTEICCMYPSISESKKHASNLLTAFFSPQIGVMFAIFLSSMLRQVDKLHEAKFKLDQSIKLEGFEVNENISKLNGAINQAMEDIEELVKKFESSQDLLGHKKLNQDLIPDRIQEVKKLLSAVEKDLKSGKLDKFLGLG
ncbi:MAG: hypothetical protein WJ306_05635 [Ferrovum myxofaciens]